jgi:ArsR family transcriptional regulator
MYSVVKPEEGSKTMTDSAIAIIDPEQLRAAAGRAVGALKLLANEDRLLLLCQLSQGEACVSDLEATLGIRQPTLSQQLGVLRHEGVVETRREGKNIYYRVASPELLQLLATLYQLYCPQGDSQP